MMSTVKVSAVNGPKSIVHIGKHVAAAAATLAVTITGVKTTDIVSAVMGASNTVTVVKAVPTEANTVTVTFSAAATAGDEVYITVMRNE
jgi:hypothetical protein